jgi:hypothetical protein
MYERRGRRYDRFVMRALIRIAVVVLCSGFALAQQTPEVATVNAELGPCSANFQVTDAGGNPLYNAKVHVLLRYGFLNKRKLDLEVGTNSEGKARVIGLPHEIKKIPVFRVSYGSKWSSVQYDPATNCHASYTIALGKTGPAPAGTEPKQ